MKTLLTTLTALLMIGAFSPSVDAINCNDPDPQSPLGELCIEVTPFGNPEDFVFSVWTVQAPEEPNLFVTGVQLTFQVGGGAMLSFHGPNDDPCDAWNNNPLVTNCIPNNLPPTTPAQLEVARVEVLREPDLFCSAAVGIYYDHNRDGEPDFGHTQPIGAICIN